MTFYTYMIRNFLKEDSPEGDLAKDMKRDKDTFPRNGTGKFTGNHNMIRRYLEMNHACADCLDVFESCWKEYEGCERSRLKKPSLRQ